MDRIFPVFCLFSFLFHGASGSSKVVEDGSKKTIQCDPKLGAMFWWFHLKESGSIEFLGSFSSKGEFKAGEDPSKFENNGKTFIVHKFDKQKHSGMYSCVSINANKLIFGEVTHLLGEPDPVKVPAPTTAAKPQEITTTKATVFCQKNPKAPKKLELSLGCELHVFIPLVAGSGLLLLLLLITILYCNRIRTRRCPHHYKR